MKNLSSADRIAACVVAALALFMMLGVRQIFRRPLVASPDVAIAALPYMP
jgi:hypothetical protein